MSARSDPVCGSDPVKGCDSVLPSAHFKDERPNLDYLKANYGPKPEKPMCFAGDEGSCESVLPSAHYSDEFLPREALGIDRKEGEQSMQYKN